MLNEVISGISIKLNNEFGDEYEIHTENVKQGLNEPCFFIKSLLVSTRPLLGKRKQRTYPFDISYFTKDGNENLMSTGERLLDCLEYIKLINGDMLRGTSMEYEIIDDVLHFSVTYSVFLNDLSKEVPMESADVLVAVKGESNGD